MISIVEFMTQEHRNCDDELATVEEAANQEDWEKTQQFSEAFLNTMETHLLQEESVMFSALEEASGITEGPTAMMRIEHQQIRDLFLQLQYAVESKDKDELMDTTETLLILLQQHNMKEEGMLYPMCDNQLAGSIDELIKKMNEITV